MPPCRPATRTLYLSDNALHACTSRPAACPRPPPQEGTLEQKGAWRARQHAYVMLGLLNQFFKSCLLAHLEHGAADRDLELPQHAERARQLLAQNTTALNMSYTPF